MNQSPRVSALLAMLLVGIAAAPAVRATIISVTGGGVIIPAPAMIGDADNPLASAQQGFDEKQGVFLFGPVAVDGGVIGPGVTVDSHMIFFNQAGTGPLTKIATWTFSGKILGVMSDTDGSLEAMSSSFLGAPGTAGYPAFGFPMRGMEGDDGYTLMTPTSLRVEMNIAQPGDWIRVVTASTVPDGGHVGTLLVFGLLALIRLHRRSGV